MLKLNIAGKDSYSKARAGYFETDNGIVETPMFMPVGTQGTVKAVNKDFSLMIENLRKNKGRRVK